MADISTPDLRLKINFHQLRCFHAVAEHGSFTAAARALLMGQPSVTTHVKALEKRFGVELFCRHGHHVELTDTGRRLHAVTRRIFNLETEAAETLSAAAGLLAGQLRVAAIGPAQVTQMVVAFGQHYPEVDLSVSLGNTKEVLESVLAFRSDVGVLPRLAEDSRFYAVPYSHTRIVLLVRRGHPWARNRTVRIEDLEGQRMVLREVGSATRRVFEQTLKAAGVRIRCVLEIESREAVRESVAAGIGIGIALEGETHPDPRLHTLEVSNAPMVLDLEVACLSERKEAPLIKAFFGVLRETLSPRSRTNTR
jgi:LysR family transcriptional regulator, low CO2-responsive transcriptional regulator